MKQKSLVPIGTRDFLWVHQFLQSRMRIDTYVKRFLTLQQLIEPMGLGCQLSFLFCCQMLDGIFRLGGGGAIGRCPHRGDFLGRTQSRVSGTALQLSRMLPHTVL